MNANRGKRVSFGHPGIMLGALVLLLILGWLDYLTGYEMSFFVFYSVPVGLAAWYVGRWAGVLLALAATVTWLVADFFSGAKYSAPFFFYWNSTIHFLAFIINAITIAKIKADLDYRHVLADELELTREKLWHAAQMPFCPGCGQPRDKAGPTVPNSSRGATVQSEVDTLLCTDCRVARQEKALP
jgi:hypothetical protein